MAARMSADSFAANGPVHIQTAGRTWQQKCQQTVLHQKVHFTYFLKAKHSSNMSIDSCAANGLVHILSEGQTRWQECQHIILW